MNGTEFLHGNLDDGITILCRERSGDGVCSNYSVIWEQIIRLSSKGRLKTMQRTLFDLLDHAFRICLADIVDDDVRAEFSKHQRVSATKTSTSSSDENRLSVELNGWIALRVGRERPGAFEKLLVVEKGLGRLVKQKVGSALTTGSLTPIPVG